MLRVVRKLHDGPRHCSPAPPPRCVCCCSGSITHVTLGKFYVRLEITWGWREFLWGRREEDRRSHGRERAGREAQPDAATGLQGWTTERVEALAPCVRAPCQLRNRLESLRHGESRVRSFLQGNILVPFSFSWSSLCAFWKEQVVVIIEFAIVGVAVVYGIWSLWAREESEH
jgi:hypothetical protein